MNRLLAVSILFLVPTPPALADSAAPSPYLGQETRAIKALSEDQVADYLSGRGMGFAKAAELNHYPGPRHVLELAGELSLSKEQRKQVKTIHATMGSQAVRVGKRIVAMERGLDQSFAAGKIAPKDPREFVNEIARLEGELRYPHLHAHLAVRAILSAHQAMRYDTLRGYATDGDTRRLHSHP